MAVEADKFKICRVGWKAKDPEELQFEAGRLKTQKSCNLRLEAIC